MSKEVYPERYLDIRSAPSLVSLALLAIGLIGVVLATQQSLWMGGAHLAVLLMLAAVLPALECALGPRLLLLVAAICGGISVLIIWMMNGAWTAVLIGAGCGAALIGVAIGYFRMTGIRPLFFGGREWAELTVPAVFVGVIWLVLELSIRAVDSAWPMVLRIQFAAAGFVVGVLVHWWQSHQTSEKFRGPGAEQALSDARDLVARHDLKRARRLLDAFAKHFPENLEARELRYAAWKFDPREPGFHSAAAALLNRDGVGADTHQYVEQWYKDYLAVTQGQPKLPIGLHLRLGQRFARAGDLKQAANIINPYLQRESKHEELPKALVTLAESYQVAKDFARAVRYAETASVLFPGTPESLAARKLLGELKSVSR